MMATNSPFAMVKSRPLRISAVRGPLQIDFRNLSTTIIGCTLFVSSLTEPKSPSAPVVTPQEFTSLIRWNDAESLFSLDSSGFSACGIGMPREHSLQFRCSFPRSEEHTSELQS